MLNIEENLVTEAHYETQEMSPLILELKKEVLEESKEKEKRESLHE